MSLSRKIFSRRYEKALSEGQLEVDLPQKLRGRIWRVLNRFDVRTVEADVQGWEENSSTFYDALRRFLDDRGSDDQIDFEWLVKTARAADAFDFIEFVYEQLWDEMRVHLQSELNEVLTEELSEWRMIEGQLYRIDTRFLSLEVLQETHDLLRAQGFGGAVEEFTEARNDLEAGDHKGAVVNSCKSFESTMKAALGVAEGNASILIRKLVQSDLCSDLQEELRGPFGEQVLLALPFLRNKLGGHGQGESPVEVPRSYAELALHLAASFIHFTVIQATLHAEKAKDAPSESRPDETEFDDVPF